MCPSPIHLPGPGTPLTSKHHRDKHGRREKPDQGALISLTPDFPLGKEPGNEIYSEVPPCCGDVYL
jgi:hypothetical protein